MPVIPNNPLNYSIKFAFEFKTNQEIFSIVNLFLSFSFFFEFIFSYPIETLPTKQTTSLERKDRILHTTKTINEPVIAVKGDYGQGTPADQHLYTTRGGTVSESEKKI